MLRLWSTVSLIKRLVLPYIAYPRFSRRYVLRLRPRRFCASQRLFLPF